MDSNDTLVVESKERLKSFVERIENLEDEKKGLSEDIRDVYSEAESAGFDKKALREIIKLRKISNAERKEHEAVVDLYLGSLGMV